MKPQCTTAAECLRELARVMEQFGIKDEIAALNSNFVKYDGWSGRLAPSVCLPAFKATDRWQFAIAEVECKPVFIGDTLYQGSNVLIATAHYHNKSICLTSVLGGLCVWSEESLTWNPPKPATVMVELTAEDAEHWAKLNGMMQLTTCRLSIACKKALEKLK